MFAFFEQWLTTSHEQKVKIKNPANGKTATATVRDECPGCGAYDIGVYRPSRGCPRPQSALLTLARPRKQT